MTEPQIDPVVALKAKHAKALKLLEAIAEEHDEGEADHAWRQCRSCLAREELDHRGVRKMLRAFLADLLHAKA